MNHELHIEGHNSIEVTGVVSVEGFDEDFISINLENEDLMINGSCLHIESLDLDTGRMTASGKVETIGYMKKKIRKSIWERLHK